MLGCFYDHYDILGYRFNPFRHLTKGEFALAFPPGEEEDALLLSQFEILQVIGDSGHGKTSLLQKLFALLGEKGENPALLYVPAQILREGCAAPVSGSSFKEEIDAILRFARDDYKDEEMVKVEAAGKLEGGAPIERTEAIRWLLLDEAQNLSQDEFAAICRRLIPRGTRIILGSHVDHREWLPGRFAFFTYLLRESFYRRLPPAIEARLKFAANSTPGHTVSDEAMREWVRLSEYSMETARHIGYELFLSKEIPPVIGPSFVIEAADRAGKSLAP